jgi:hypothetical protein
MHLESTRSLECVASCVFDFVIDFLKQTPFISTFSSCTLSFLFSPSRMQRPLPLRMSCCFCCTVMGNADDHDEARRFTSFFSSAPFSQP